MDPQGNLVIPYMYQGLSHFEKGISVVCKLVGSQKQFGIINKNNDIILPFFKYELFDVVRNVWEKDKKICFADFNLLLVAQKYAEAQAFLTTILHFQTEKYTEYVDLTSDDIQIIRSLIDASHKTGKKLLPLLTQIEELM
jgi:hypothetical protein